MGVRVYSVNQKTKKQVYLSQVIVNRVRDETSIIPEKLERKKKEKKNAQVTCSLSIMSIVGKKRMLEQVGS